MKKKIIFICGSPRKKKSASFYTASYLAKFLNYDYEFVDVVQAQLSENPQEAEPGFISIVKKIKKANAVVWTFGAWVMYTPVQLQYFIDKLFAQQYRFENAIACSIMTSAIFWDDYILNRVKFASEQLGFGYIGDITAEGNPYIGYMNKEEETEMACRVLAQKLNRALDRNYIPVKSSAYINNDFLSPLKFGKGFRVTGPETPKTGDKTILVLTGNNISGDPAAASVYKTISRFSRNTVELIEMEEYGIKPCSGCYLCNFKPEGICILKDRYEEIKEKMHKAHGIIVIGQSVSGMVDSRLKAFLDRAWCILHQPILTGKYGFVVATGGGFLDLNASWYLNALLQKYGVQTIDALTGGGSGGTGLCGTVRWTVENLDLAIDENWKCIERFIVKAGKALFRDYIVNYGMLLRADFNYLKKNRMFDYPSLIGTAFTRFLFKIEPIKKLLLNIQKKYVFKKREKRLKTVFKISPPGTGKNVT